MIPVVVGKTEREVLREEPCPERPTSQQHQVAESLGGFGGVVPHSVSSVEDETRASYEQHRSRTLKERLRHGLVALERGIGSRVIGCGSMLISVGEEY